MFTSLKFIIVYLLLITLLLLKEIPYINILIKDKLWIIVILFYIFFTILLIPSNLLTKLKKTKYLIVFYIFTIVALLVFTFIPLIFLLELGGTILYVLLWILAIYKIFIYLKSSDKNS